MGVALMLSAALSAAAPALELSPCRIDAGPATATAKAMCGTLEVAENPDAPDGRKIGLSVALVPALSVEAFDDPLVLLAGGPGQSAIDAYLQMGAAFERIRRQRPILLVDQRGTGRSNPLHCQNSEAMLEAGEFDPALIREEAVRCRDSLDADLRFYNTSVAVRDLDAVREALGFDTLNLWGGSYGTRVALHYLRRYPEHTRSVVLDGVIPGDFLLGPTLAIDAQRSLDLLFDRCAESEACAQAFPGLPQTFATLQARLAEAPVTVTVPHPRDGTPSEQRLSHELLAGVIRLSSYSPATRALIPLLVSEAASGRYTMLAAQAALIETQMQDMMAIGMHNSVVCSEDAPRYGAADVDKDALADTYIGAAQFEALQSICEVWPQGPVDDGFAAPVESDVPVLLLSGEFDPVTPPAYGDRTAETLSNRRHIVAPGQGHIVSATGCVPKLLHQFVETLDPEGIDPSCVVDRLDATPFFITQVGPMP